MNVNKLSTGIEVQDPKLSVFICYDGDGKGNPSVDVYEKDTTGKIIRSYKSIHGGITECREYDSKGCSHGTYNWRNDMWFDNEGNVISETIFNSDK